MTRNYWFKTSDPNILMFVPQFEDSDIVVVDCTDPEQVAYYNPPPDADFNFDVILKESAIDEVVAIAHDFNPKLEVNTDVMGMTFAK